MLNGLPVARVMMLGGIMKIQPGKKTCYVPLLGSPCLLTIRQTDSKKKMLNFFQLCYYFWTKTKLKSMTLPVPIF
jgi:hypothetical protein